MPSFKDILNLLNHIYANTSSRILLCGTLLFIIILFNPTLSYGRLAPIDPRDIYIYKTITLNVNFNYTSSSSRSDNYSSGKHRSLSENYRLSLTGNLIDPRFIIYNSYISYSANRDLKQNFSGRSLTMTISSTIFRKFNYPFTVYENRSYLADSIRDSFGARSLLKFRRLPETILIADWRRMENKTITTFNSNYQILMRKDIGPTKNKLNYSYGINNSGTKNSRLHLTNITRLSRVTTMSAALSRHKATPNNSTTATNKGLGVSMSLSSNAGYDFTQNHSYSYYSSELISPNGIANVTGQNYSGAWSFHLFDNITTGGGLSVAENNSTSASSDDTNKNLHTNWSLIYKPFTKLILSLTTSYSRNETENISVTTNESFHEQFSLSTNIGYSRKIRTANFSSGYGIGYTEVLSLPNAGGGAGISHNLGLSLSNLHYKKVYFSTSFNAILTDNIIGDYWNSKQSFNLNAKPRYFSRYGSFNSSYSFSRSNAWQYPGPFYSHRVFLQAIAKTIKRTDGSASYTYTLTQSPYLSAFPDKSSTTRLSLSHRRPFMGRPLVIKFSTIYKKTEIGPAINRTIVTHISTTYSRPLYRRFFWRSNINYQRNSDLQANQRTTNTNLSNSILYRLRRWYISAEHRFSTSLSPSNKRNLDEQFMLQLTRSFSIRKR